MFYTTLSEDGFCYIPSVNVVDKANIRNYRCKLLKTQPITRELVKTLLDSGGVMFKFDTAQEALDFAVAMYKKMPRYQRQLGYHTDPKNPDVAYYANKYRTMSSRGAGGWEYEVADKYL